MEKSSQVMLLSCMGAMMKGMLKGFNKRMSHIIVVKEQEMEIGGPTDVKHVAHIGFDGSTTTNTAPSWMGEFKTGPGFAACSIGRTSGSAVPPLSATQTTTEICKVMSEASPAPPPKKHRRKKHKKSSSPSPTASSTTKTSGRSSHPKRKSKAKAADGNAKITNLEVAS